MATADEQILASKDMGAARARVEAIFKNRDVVPNPGDIARIAREVVSGKRTFDSVRSSVEWRARNAPNPTPQPDETPWAVNDGNIASGGNVAAIEARVRAIFNNRGVPVADGRETEAQRISRIAREVASGKRTFDSVRASVDWIAQNVQPGTKNPPPDAPPGTPGEQVGPDGLTGPQRNAWVVIQNMLKEYGLETMSGRVLELIKEGYQADAISYLLQDSPEYKQRFKANDARRKAGLSVLSPREYLALERSYRQVLQAAGMPTGFYDSLDDYAGWIGGDVSPAEIQDRAVMAAEAVNQADPYFKQALKDYYGVKEGQLAAFMLDSKRALPLLQRDVKAAQIGGAGKRHGLAAPGLDRAQSWADRGVTAAQADEAYGTMAGFLPDAGKIGGRFNETYDQVDAEEELLGNSALASEKRKRLSAMETSLFSGNSAARSESLSTRTSGAY